MHFIGRVGLPNRTRANRTEPNIGRTRGQVRSLANTNRDEQSLPMFGSPGCSVRQNSNRTELACPMFVFGSCSVRLIRYNVVSHIFINSGSLMGQAYVSLLCSRTTS